MHTRRASCSCGQLLLDCVGDPARISICHCLACQQRTGSVFGAQARFRRDQVTIAGESTTWVRVGDAGTAATFHFCPVCGATVYWAMAGDIPPFTADYVAIAIGAFADPGFPTPTATVYESRRHPWVETHLGPDAVRMD